MFNPKLVAAAARGQQRTLAGQLNTRKNKFILYSPDEPNNWNENLRAFLRQR
ncbi:hypothetical protein [Microseira wollei]|uniref:hypothetical protein n=1 Tax=Microseira wollei TaxID=467598 RepID=UPI001CFC95BE|nr:hypothetical protein [Microseira wollei]